MRRSTPLRPKTRLARYTELKQRSSKKAKEIRESRPVVREVFERDGGCVLRGHRKVAGRCFGVLTPHHLTKQSKQGEWTHLNLVALCAHHNEWVENGDPALAHRLGLVIRNGETNQSAWVRMAAARLPVRGGAA